jgi:hypothetical protein
MSATAPICPLCRYAPCHCVRMPNEEAEAAALEAKARREYERQKGATDMPWDRLLPAMQTIWKAYIINGYSLPPR